MMDEQQSPTDLTAVLVDGQKKSPKKLPQYVAALSATLGAFAFGNVFAWTSPASEPLLSGSYIPGVKVTTSQEAWIGALMPLGAAFMSFPISYLMDAIGRKAAMLWMTLPFLLGWALTIWANGVEMLYVSRFILGMAGGAFAVAAPVYSAETAEPSIRGRLGGYYELIIVLGMVFSYALGCVVSLFALSITSGFVPLIFLLVFFFMPESPLFYVLKDREEDARCSLHWLRGPDYDIEEEVEEFRQRCRQQTQQSRGVVLRELKKGTVRKALSISVGLMVFQQISGSNAVTFYTSSMFREAKIDLDPNVATVIIGVLLFVGGFISSIFVDRWGRRALLSASASIMLLCATTMGFYYHLELHQVAWLPIVCLGLYMFAVELGFGPIPWMIVGELFLPNMQGFASSISVCSNYIIAFLVTKFYSDLVAWLGAGVTFWIFSVALALAVVFVWVFVVETKGKTAQEIQQALAS